jgi:calcium/calmodulin-dependent protein kinase I
LQCKPYDNAVDLWSIGVTTYIVLSSNFPFYAKSDHQLFEKIIRVEYDFNGAEWEDVSEEAKDFIRRLLVADPRQRMTTEQCLQHPWLAKAVDY